MKNNKKKIFLSVILISILSIVIIRNRSNPEISKSKSPRSINSIKNREQRNDQNQLEKEKSDVSQKKRIESVPIGSNITLLEFKNIMKTQFDEMELELNDKYECPGLNKDVTSKLPFEVNSTHCKKSITQHELDIRISNTFDQNSYMQFLISVRDKVTKKSYTVFSISFQDDENLSMSLSMLNRNLSCFEIYFSNNAYRELVQDEYYKRAVKDFVRNKTKWIKTHPGRVKLHSEIKGKIVGIMKVLCRTYDDKRACSMIAEIQNFNCND